MHVHACMLALHLNRPVKMSYLRDESFVGHVRRHPAQMWFRHHATPEGRLVKVEARVLLDGGAYASTSAYTAANSARFACGPYRVPNAVIDATCVRTNNAPSGAMRGFGVVQVCYAHESQMDKLAAAVGLDPVEIRLRNALVQGDELVTGQTVDVPAPVRECLEAAANVPMPPSAGEVDDYGLPGGAGRTADGRGSGEGSATRSGSRTSPTPRDTTTTPGPDASSTEGWPRSRARPRNWARGS